MTAPLHGQRQHVLTIASAAVTCTVLLLNCTVYCTTAPRLSATTTEQPQPPTVVYLTRGMTDRINCPVKAKPPSTLIVWSENNSVIDTTSSHRLNVDHSGALVIDNVTSNDAGLYKCTQYSPLNSRHPNFNLTVIVKGTIHLLCVQYFPVFASSLYSTTVCLSD